jgi:hypothetical protein
MDQEGKSIGVNMFFEPFYKKAGYLTLSKSFLKNRYYSHLYDTGSVEVCTSNKICFTRPSERSQNNNNKNKNKN